MEAITLSLIGKSHDALGEKQRALGFYDQSLAIMHEVGDTRSEAATLNNIGLVYDSLGERRKAIEYYNRALPILRAATTATSEHRRTEAVTLVNLGLAYDNLGEKQKALNHYNRALPILRATGDRAEEAVTLNNIGFVYDSLGEKQQALNYFDQALPILKSIGAVRVEAITLNNIGFVYDSLGEKQKAIEYYNRALPVLRAARERFYEAFTLNNIGLVHHSLKEYERALEYFTQALSLRRDIGDRPGEAVSLGDTGLVYFSLGETQKALEFYNQSLTLSRAVEDRKVEAEILRRIALAERVRGNLAQARRQMEAALTIIETLRTRIAGQQLRASYFATVQQHFETYISLLMQQHRQEPLKGYDALALQASERARARGMLEMLAEARADIRQGVHPRLLERERGLQNKLAALTEKQSRLINERQAIEQSAALKQEIEKVLDEYQQVEAEIRTTSPRYAALTQPVPLGLKEIQRQTLDADTILLEYSLGGEKSFVWMVTPNALKSFELPARAEIESAARLVYKLLTERNRQIKFETVEEKRLRVEKADREYLSAATQLSSMLLSPFVSELEKKRLLIVADGALNYIPFAALPLPQSPESRVRSQESKKTGHSVSDSGLQTSDSGLPLIVRHEIVMLPSASTLAALRRETAGRKPVAKTLAVIADPVFDKRDARVKAGEDGKKPETRSLAETRSEHHAAEPQNTRAVIQANAQASDGARIERLPFTRLEAAEILSLVPASSSKRSLDFDASRATATSPELGQYRYVHFATHGVLDSEHPELSALVLSLVNRAGAEQDGFLWAHEVFNLRLPIEMVVLSGCRTGLGKEIKGEGLVGLTRGFMYAGAARVVVSLWDISDEASAELMTEIYKGLLGRERLRPAAALRNAQLTVWKEKRWQAPYYWAAFVLQGEAK
ncbi:MAG: CHAT domain-containing protein [Pyrinomonadaceae bacterium]|nr:CHAT domain-containing protein [Pyrinomonadaceae bacterium]